MCGPLWMLPTVSRLRSTGKARGKVVMCQPEKRTLEQAFSLNEDGMNSQTCRRNPVAAVPVSTRENYRRQVDDFSLGRLADKE